MATIRLTKDNLKETLKNNEIVFIDFWAQWCAPCRRFAPIFEEASENFENIVFGKVNTEEERELAGAFQIRSIPMLMAFRQEIPVFGQPGMLPKDSFEDLIHQVLELDMEDVHRQYNEQLAKQQGQ